MMVEPKKLVQQFINDLSTLRSCDKYKIGALTVFASEHKDNPEVVRGIIQACCENVINISSQHKLSSLYVIDSIVKNIPEPYSLHFTKRIADLFFDAFQKSRDSDIRKKFYKLRVTWNDFFTPEDLYKLDTKVRSEDANWPVLIQEPSSKVSFKSLSNVQKIPKKKTVLDHLPAAPPPDTTPPTVEDVIVSAERDPRRKMRSETAAKGKDDMFLIDRAGDQAMESVANKMGQNEFDPQRRVPELSSPRDVDMRLPRQPFEPPVQPERLPQYHHPPYARLPRLPPPVMHGPPISGPDWNVEIPDFPDMVPIGVDPRMLSLTRNPKPDKTIQIDNIPYPLLLDRIQPLVRVDNTVHAVRFRCQSVNVMIDDRKYTIPGTGFKMINMYSGKTLIYLGGPGHELVLDGVPHTVPMNSSSSVTYINHKNRSLGIKFIGQVPSNVNVLPAIPAHFLKWAALGLFGNPQQLAKPAKNPLIGLEDINDLNHKEKPVNGEEVDIQDLFSRLVANGIVQKYPEKKTHDHPETRKLPDLQKYIKEDFSVPYIPEVEALFDGYQCVSCGLRFSSENSPAYANHLDYHYIKKSHDNEDAVKNHNWYQNSSFWLLGENSHDNQATEFEASVIEQREVKKCPAFSDPLKNVCSVCMEKLESYWDASDDEWMLRDAISVDGKVFHSICLDDAGKQLSVSVSREAALKVCGDGSDEENTSEIDNGEAMDNLEEDMKAPASFDEDHVNFTFSSEQDNHAPKRKQEPQPKLEESEFAPSPSKLMKIDPDIEPATPSGTNNVEKPLLTPGTVSMDPLAALQKALKLPQLR